MPRITAGGLTALGDREAVPALERLLGGEVDARATTATLTSLAQAHAHDGEPAHAAQAALEALEIADDSGYRAGTDAVRGVYRRSLTSHRDVPEVAELGERLASV